MDEHARRLSLFLDTTDGVIRAPLGVAPSEREIRLKTLVLLRVRLTAAPQ